MFSYLSKDCHPIATSLKYSQNNKNFTDSKIKHLLAEKIIEPSNSTCQAQVIITINENGKKDHLFFSQIINHFTQLDICYIFHICYQ